MPNKDGTGPKGQGPKDGHGMGNGRGKNPGQGPMTGGSKGVKEDPKKRTEPLQRSERSVKPSLRAV